MYFSEQLLKSLILDLALKEYFRPETARNLVYHLTLPGRAVPLFVAEVLAEAPTLSANQSHFPERLAYGVLDDGLERFDVESRRKRQAKLFRNINLIQLGLRTRQCPDQIIMHIRECYAELHFAYESAACLASEEREPSGPELSALLEQLIETTMRQSVVVLLLVERLVSRCNGAERHRLLRRAEDGIEHGLQNDPIKDEDIEQLVVELNQPVRFRESLLSQLAFRTAASRLLTELHSRCR